MIDAVIYFENDNMGMSNETTIGETFGADAILAALADAGLTPPMPTGRLHKALQDAFQAGGIEAVETLQKPGKFLTGKHIYCDKELKKLLEGSE